MQTQILEAPEKHVIFLWASTNLFKSKQGVKRWLFFCREHCDLLQYVHKTAVMSCLISQNKKTRKPTTRKPFWMLDEERWKLQNHQPLTWQPEVEHLVFCQLTGVEHRVIDDSCKVVIFDQALVGLKSRTVKAAGGGKKCQLAPDECGKVGTLCWYCWGQEPLAASSPCGTTLCS